MVPLRTHFLTYWPLAEAGLAWMGERGIRRAEIQVAVENAGARAFWRALGFEAAMDVLERRL